LLQRVRGAPAPAADDGFAAPACVAAPAGVRKAPISPAPAKEAKSRRRIRRSGEE